MALGGGVFTTQNKVLPGAYINFVSAARASATLSERGVATMPYTMDWGTLGEVVEVTAESFQKNSTELFGYDYTAPQLKGLRDLFRNLRSAYLYRLGAGGAKASNSLAVARWAGERGNQLKISVSHNVDDPNLFDVVVYLDDMTIDEQTAGDVSELVNNSFVVWKTDGVLTETAGLPLEGGANPTVTNADYQTYLNLVEQYSFNAIGCPSADATVKGLFAAFTKRLRDEQGVKFQCVLYNPDTPTDYEGAYDLLNGATGDDAEWSGVYWVTGVAAGTAVNRSALNKIYDGEFTLSAEYTQTQLKDAIRNGKFALHRVGKDLRVLADVNSLTTTTVEKGEDFKQNQTIRVLDQIANDVALLFRTKYLGVVPNDADGRISLWSDIVTHHRQLQTIRAIEGFSSEHVKVTAGETKRSVMVSDTVTPVNAMEQLYMICVVA